MPRPSSPGEEAPRPPTRGKRFFWEGGRAPLRFTHTLRFRLIVLSVLCTAVVSLAGNLSLYGYLNDIINQRAAHIDEIYLSTLQSQLNTYLTDLNDLAVLCASDSTVSRSLNASKAEAIDAQERLDAYLATSPVQNYIDVLSVVNDEGLIVSATAQTFGELHDYEAILAQPLYRQAVERGADRQMGVVDSIHSSARALAMIRPIQGLGSRPGQGYLYVELNLELLDRALEPYTELNPLFVAEASGELVTARPAEVSDDFTAGELTDGDCMIGGRLYEVRSEPLSMGGLRLYHCVLQTELDQEGIHILYTVIAVVALSLLLALCLSVLFSAYFSRPISRLNDRLRRIAANDFSFDPAIEKPQDELGQIGRTVNEMSMSIQHLLRETEAMYNQRRNIEIDLLQSQVNPHFLYNTLDSIRWMAVIQKNPGIANITRSLSNLLKNIAKGTQDKIPLREELGLLNDYIAIQSVRYLETFTFENRVPEELYDCRIVKLTLQPLVENAIFHGIEPTGECGTITLTGRAEGGDLYLCVEDDGAGIEPERLAGILTTERKRSGSSMNGIGIANVHKRLQLIYGRQYGLKVESEPGKYTRVTVHLPKEV